MENQEYWCLIPFNSMTYEVIYLEYSYHRFIVQVLVRYNIDVDDKRYIFDGMLHKYGDYYVLRCSSDRVKERFVKSLRLYSIKQILE